VAHPGVLQFLELVNAECAAARVRVQLDGRRRTRQGDLGSFSEGKRVLQVCTRNEDWALILAHELAHVRQEQAGAFRLNEDVYSLLDNWLAGKQSLSTRKVRHIVRTIQKIEHEAERGALKLSREYSLCDDTSAYIAGANTYIWKYEVARITGVWPKYPEGYDPKVWSPKRLMRLNQIGKPPAAMFDLMINSPGRPRR
jgi:hypothetical protein